MALVDTIKLVCGVNDAEEDLNITDEEFTTLLEAYIDATEEWVQSYLNREFVMWPSGLEQIVIEMVCNIIKAQILRLDLPTYDTENQTYNIRRMVEEVVSDDIRLRLRPYAGRRIGMFGIGTKAQYDTLMDSEEDSELDNVE